MGIKPEVFNMGVDGGGVVQTKKPYVGGVWIFSET